MSNGFDGFSTLLLEVGGFILFLVLVLWLARRNRPFGGGFSARDCAVLRTLPLGPRERIMVIKIGRRHFVVGVGSATVSLLCELDEPLAGNERDSGGFADLIRKALTR